MAELIGTTGDDTLIGGAENDEIHGLEGDDILSGRLGDDSLFAGPGQDTLRGGKGDDVLYALPLDEDEVLRGGDGFDLLDLARFGATATLPYEPLFVDLQLHISEGIGGNDLLVDIEAVVTPDAGADFPAPLDDTLKGDDQANLFSSGAGNDRLKGHEGADTLFGASGNDLLKGGRGRDSLNGGDDADTLNGGSGDDFLNGGAGHDLLTGGKGEDTFRFATRSRDVVTDFEPESDTLMIASLLVQDLDALRDQASELDGDLKIDLDGGGRIILRDTSLDALTEENTVFFDL